MRISRRTHAFLDFATAGFALAFPRVFGAGSRFTAAATMLGLGKIGYALLTRHELGAVKLIPMKSHLVLDSIGGATLCALPFVLDEQENRAVVACALGMGIFDIVAAPMTDTQSQPSNVPALRRRSQQKRRTIGGLSTTPGERNYSSGPVAAR